MILYQMESDIDMFRWTMQLWFTY